MKVKSETFNIVRTKYETVALYDKEFLLNLNPNIRLPSV